MSKILSEIFPILDHLYIYQILEYKSLDFIKWFLKNPFKRNLQKKHKLEWTKKARLLGLISITMWILDSIITSLLLFGSLWGSLILAPLKALYFPLFLITAQLFLLPFENYQKEKIIEAAKEKLKKLKNLKIAAITGSYGKTSTKDILFTLLWKKYYVVKTQRSFNTPLSIARTVLEDLKDNTDVFIAEAGAYKKGEIETIARLLNPDIGIITAVAPQHLERFGSIENIAKAKFELVENLKADGTAILNKESEWLKKLGTGKNIIFFGTDSKYYASEIKTGNEGTSFIFHTPKASGKITIPVIGENHVKNFVAASTAALELGLSFPEIKERAKLLLPTPHRLEIRKQGNMILIDNSYNTNPESAKKSLELLSSFKENRKIIITPGFIELGKEAPKKNQELGHEIRCIADEVIFVGKNAKHDLLKGIKSIDPQLIEPLYFVNSTQEGLTLAQQLIREHNQRVARDDVEVVVLLENDLPDQYF